jgi:hypothetical protein
MDYTGNSYVSYRIVSYRICTGICTRIRISIRKENGIYGFHIISYHVSVGHVCAC